MVGVATRHGQPQLVAGMADGRGQPQYLEVCGRGSHGSWWVWLVGVAVTVCGGRGLAAQSPYKRPHIFPTFWVSCW